MSQSNNITFYNAEKVLLLGADRVGDMLFSTPAIAMLHAVRPGITMDIIVFSPAAKEVLLHNPAIGTIHVSPHRWALKRLAKQYDLTIAVYDGKKALRSIPHLTNVHHYLRESKPIAMKMHPASFLQRLLERPDLKVPDFYQLHPQPEHEAKVRHLLEQQGVDWHRDRLIGCHMGSLRVAKRGARWFFRSKSMAGVAKTWDFQNYARLAEQLQQRYPEVKLVLTGTKGELAIAEKFLLHQPNVINLIGQTSLLEMAALMKYCEQFLTADTGPLHVACAMDIPLVALYGKTDPSIYGPLPHAPHRRVLRNSSDVNDITVDQVINALFDGQARKQS